MKFKFVFLTLVFCFSGSLPALDRVVDNAGILKPDEIADLKERIAKLSAAYDFDLVIVTEKSTGGKSAMAYADDFFDYEGYGLGGDRDGCLFLQVTGSRDYWFSTSGRGIGIMNDTAGSKLEDDTVKHLSNGDYYGAYHAFLSAWEEFLVLDAKGRSYNFFHRRNLILVVASWLIALLTGVLIVKSWASKMDTALKQTHAASYIVSGSLAFREKSDRFLYSHVARTKRQTDSGSGGRGIHTGSSGRSHGGRGGRY